MTALIKTYFPKLASAVLALTLAAAALPLAASAQVQAQEIQGTIQSIDGTFNITVQDQNGYLDNVELHQGTVINPTGLTLASGMSVTIDGYDNGSVFEANVINTPYQYSGPVATPVYYGPGWWYPGFAYGYGPSFSLFIGTGGYIVSRPWYGHWWSPTPVHAFYGPGWGVGVRYGGVSVSVRGGYAPRYAVPEATRSYRYPESGARYSAPAPAARPYGGGGNFQRWNGGSEAPRYSAPPQQQQTRTYNTGGNFQRYNAGGNNVQHYSAPQQQQQTRTYNTGGSYQRGGAPAAPRYSAPSGGQRYSGGARAQAGGRDQGR
ncbi:MAG: hypothetical protein JO092_05220 [Candidatus Eremiobacteraeota bacterium]|nr:hypothetical protein [Candidatus Eremiobacteraeota bacterium]